MRPDMAKLIVERPRVGGGGKYPRARDKRLFLQNPEEARAREPYKSRHFHQRKFFNENLAPLRRFLRSNLGKPWNEVHAEIAAQVPKNSTINLHVWQHIEMDVAKEIAFINGIPYSKYYSWGRFPHRGFFVHPTTGLLLEYRETKQTRRLRGRLKGPSPDILPISDTLEYHRISNIWYAITFAAIPTTHFVWDVLKKETVIQTTDPRHNPRTTRYATHKRQLNKKEIHDQIHPRLKRYQSQRTEIQTQLTKARPQAGFFVIWVMPMFFVSAPPRPPPRLRVRVCLFLSVKNSRLPS